MHWERYTAAIVITLSLERGLSREVTFSKDIAPILFQNCAPCHRPGQSAPFSLLDFSDAKKHAADIAKATRTRYMPPWLPEQGYGEFRGERRLTGEAIELLQQWTASGAPEGIAGDLPLTPTFPDGWLLGKPDLVVELPQAYELAPEGKDLYRNFVIPAPLVERRYVRAFEFHPRNRSVHHVRIKFDATSQSRRLDQQDAEPGFGGMKTPARFPFGHMTTWVPGQLPHPVPSGLQWVFEKNADVVLQIHLQRTGKPELIQPQIGFYFTDQPPTKESFLMGLTSELIDIPAGEKNYVVERKFPLPVDVEVQTILPHLHYLGKTIEAFAMLSGGEKRWLLKINDWDFNWQGEYQYKAPLQLPADSVVTMRYTFDNSAENVRNPNHPPRRVVYGPQSSDEMAELWLQVLPRNRTDLALLEKIQRQLNDEETVAFYEKQLRASPRDAAVHTALGKVLGPMQRLEEAYEHFRTAVEIDPKQVEGHYYLGLSLVTLGRANAAKSEFETVLRLDPNYARAHDGLGLIALKANNFREAEAHFRHALEINPDDPAAREHLQRINAR